MKDASAIPEGCILLICHLPEDHLLTLSRWGLGLLLVNLGDVRNRSGRKLVIRPKCLYLTLRLQRAESRLTAAARGGRSGFCEGRSEPGQWVR